MLEAEDRTLILAAHLASASVGNLIHRVDVLPLDNANRLTV